MKQLENKEAYYRKNSSYKNSFECHFCLFKRCSFLFALIAGERRLFLHTLSLRFRPENATISRAPDRRAVDMLG